MAKKEALTCPNCGQAAEKLIREGRTYILCESEDKVYELTATGAKFRSRGRLDDIERRLAALEGKPEPEPEPKPKPADEVTEDDGEEEDGGPCIEITFGDEDEDGEEEDDGDERDVHS